MTIHNAIILLEQLKNDAQNKSEIRIYEQFLHMLSELKKRDLSPEDVKSIELELDQFNLDTIADDRKKRFGKAVRQFGKFLEDRFSFISKGHYTKLGVGLGSSFGILLGIIFLSNLERSLGIALGLSIGMTIGLIIGHIMDSKATAEGKVL
jgi:hypothetical protein